MYRFAMCLIKGTFSKDRNDKNRRVDDIKKGLSILNEAASGKEPCGQALAELGMLYQHGYFCQDLDRIEIMAVDLKKAIEFNNKAMQLDLPRAINNLGLIFYNNKSMNPNNPNEKV